MSNKAATILLTLPNQRLNEAVAIVLRDAGWGTALVDSGKAALEYLSNHTVEAVLAPVLLKDMPGTKLFRSMRSSHANLILLLLAAGAGSHALQMDSQCDVVVDPSGGVDAIIEALDRFSDRTGLVSNRASSREVERKTIKGAAADLPSRAKLSVGSLAMTDPARVVGGVLRLTLTGILTFEHGETKRELWVEGGRPVFAASTNIRERFGEHLVRAGKITGQQLTTALSAMQKGHKLGETLAGIGALDLAEVENYVAFHIRERLIACFEDFEASYSFDEAPVQAPSRVEALPEPLELLRLATHAHYSQDKLDPLLPHDTVLRLAMPLQGISQLAGLNESGTQALQQLGGRTTVGELLSKSPNPLATHQLYYALYAGGALFERK